MKNLRHLISEACALGGTNPCAAGHEWESDGGRACPQDLTWCCSQAVYRCAKCGAHDYGEKHGPGYKDCEESCEFKHCASTAKAEDTELEQSK